MPERATSRTAAEAPVLRQPLQLVRLPVEKPGPAVSFLQMRSRGVMDLIAHFWERLSQTPPLLRNDLHLVTAIYGSTDLHITISQLNPLLFSGAMLYVPKAHRADVMALDPATAAAFAAYISHQGPRPSRPVETAAGNAAHSAAGDRNGDDERDGSPIGAASATEKADMLPFADLSGIAKAGGGMLELPADPSGKPNGGGVGNGTANGRVPIDFLTGEASGIGWMTPLLLPLVNKRAPARKLVNVVMQLPGHVDVALDPHVRLARDADVPVLNRWRRLYKEERGILFDADMDAWVEGKRVFVYEVDQQVVAVAKVDLELAQLSEIGGVFTFPEFRKQGFGGRIVRDIAARIRQTGKVPTLQVDEQNVPALNLYQAAGWQTMGKLSRVWLTG
jgi:GNAT superfamily N-acetyltransferase